MTRLSIIVAKTSSERNDFWLPLTWHLLDTAETMSYLQREWMPLGSKSIFDLKPKDLTSLLRYLALTHDLGKATPAFQQRITSSLPEKVSELEENGLHFSDDNFHTKKVYHAHMGANLLREAGCPECISAIIGAHHGTTEESNVEDDIQDYPYLYFGRAEEWKEIQNEYLQWALQEAGYSSYLCRGGQSF